ncbi:MAG: peptidase S45 [Nonomuraea sp.]|nr:peptidase S45 [Nonomuraea sp.]
MRLILAALLALPLLAMPASASAGPYQAQIRRTEYGIPHVTARDYGGLGYGYGYAFAQDNLCVMASFVQTLRGERSRYFGPEALSDDSDDPVPNLTSDVYHKSVAESGVLRRVLALPPPLGPSRQLRGLVDGYVAGYNRYLEETGVDRLPDPTCRGKAWVGPITADDVWSNLLDLARAAGTTAAKSEIVGDAAAQPQRRPNPPGSNAWALGRDSTRDGTGMVLANPHYPWQGMLRFYQVQLTIPGVLDVSGGSLYGTPVVQIGHTATTAWTHTVSNAQHATVYQLQLAPGDPTSYLIDGRAEPAGKQEVVVALPGGGVSSHTLYTSRYGPILAAGRTKSSVLTLADANATNLRMADQWLALASSKSVDDVRAIDRRYQAIPFVHTLAADSTGTAFYTDSSRVPRLTDAQLDRCTVKDDLLNGSDSSCAWGADPDALQPGVYGPAAYPALTRTDHLANSNEDPWLVSPAQPLSFPRVYGRTGTELSLRPRLSQDMAAKGGFTLDTMTAALLQRRNHSAELLKDDVVAMCRANPTLTGSDGARVDVREACRVLATWNSRATLDARGAVLWREFFARTHRGGDDWWKVPFDPAHALTTPRGMVTTRPAVRQALADTVTFFRANRIPLGQTLRKAQRIGSIPVPGCEGGEGCFDRVTSGPLEKDGTFPDVDGGTSFVMLTELTRTGPRTRTILTYSLSANPASPHYRDQTELYARGGWVDERFTAAEIAASPQLRVTELTN